MVWKCSTRLCLSGPLRDVQRRGLCPTREGTEGEIREKDRLRVVPASEVKRGRQSRESQPGA